MSEPEKPLLTTSKWTIYQDENLTTFVARYPSCVRHPDGRNRSNCGECNDLRMRVDAERAQIEKPGKL